MGYQLYKVGVGPSSVPWLLGLIGAPSGFPHFNTTAKPPLTTRRV